MKNLRFSNRPRERQDFPRRNFSAVCSECGKDCQVPFKPSGGKPVYCSDCFGKKGGRDSNRSDWRESRGSSADLRGDIATLNTKLDVIIKLLAAVGQKNADKKTDLTADKIQAKPKQREKTS